LGDDVSTFLGTGFSAMSSAKQIIECGYHEDDFTTFDRKKLSETTTGFI
jgi:hypothetical protein